MTALALPDQDFAPALPAVGECGISRLLPARDWASLPRRVQLRFSKRITEENLLAYRGLTEICRLNWAGWLLVHLARLIGAPLPLEQVEGAAAMVTVTRDGMKGGQIWSRLYTRKRHFPQVIHSAKRFCGPTGLEEYLGNWIGIAERVERLDDGICFISDHYFLKFGPLRLRLPKFLSPGHMRVEHRDCGGGEFYFTLELIHPLLGEMIFQQCRFTDGPEITADILGGQL